MDISITVISQGNTAKKMKLIANKLSDTTKTTTSTTKPISLTCHGFKQRQIRCRISDNSWDRCREQNVVVRTRSKRKRNDNNNDDDNEYWNDKSNDKTKRYGRFFGDVIPCPSTTDVAFDKQRYNDADLYTNMDLDQCCTAIMATRCSSKDGAIKQLLRYGFSSKNNNKKNNNDGLLETPLHKTLEKFEQLRFVNDDGSSSSYENDVYCQLLPTITEEVIMENEEEEKEHKFTADVIEKNQKENQDEKDENNNYEYEQVANCEPFYWNKISFPEDFCDEKRCCESSESVGDGCVYVMMCSPYDNDGDQQQHVYECIEQMER